MPGSAPVASRVRAKTRNSPATGALVMNRLDPLITQSSPSRTARVRRPAGFEPAPGSVSAKDATTSPEAIRSSQEAFCASVP